MINFDDLSLEEQMASTQREIARKHLMMKLTKESLVKLEKTKRDDDWKIRKNYEKNSFSISIIVFKYVCRYD